MKKGTGQKPGPLNHVMQAKKLFLANDLQARLGWHVLYRMSLTPGLDRKAPDLDKPDGGLVIEGIAFRVGCQVMLVDGRIGLHGNHHRLPLEEPHLDHTRNALLCMVDKHVKGFFQR